MHALKDLQTYFTVLKPLLLIFLSFQLKNAFDNLFEGLMESKDGEKEAANVGLGFNSYYMTPADIRPFKHMECFRTKCSCLNVCFARISPQPFSLQSWLFVICDFVKLELKFILKLNTFFKKKKKSLKFRKMR